MELLYNNCDLLFMLSRLVLTLSKVQDAFAAVQRLVKKTPKPGLGSFNGFNFFDSGLKILLVDSRHHTDYYVTQGREEEGPS